ncbi:S8 family serine peptidase [Streptosporangium sp. NPDC000239]|uniref:S8 family serine peptidase n=1 Tax=Streptosporangium sp. NPDC000239 TaxID=3154248 RepID=UPI0033173F5B
MLRRLGAAGALITLCLGVCAPAVADDARRDQRWVLEKMNVEQAWKITKGAGVTVALVDSDVDAQVPELRGRVTVGPEMGSAGPVGDDAKEIWHGTAMASLIAGGGRGEGGLLGIAPEARVLSLPLILRDSEQSAPPLPEQDQRTGTNSPVARAIRYAADHGAKVISMSLGAYGPQKSEREAVSYALAKGVVLVAAAGNDGETPYAVKKDTSFWSFPAGYSGVIGVGAVNERSEPAGFSSDNLSVLVSAPGVEVPVVVPGGGYRPSDGTSSAAALVAGVAALIKAKYPDIPPYLVARALSSTATSAPIAGYDDHVGFGVVDAGAALVRAGELLRASAGTPPDEGERHFGAGLPTEEPARPGPDVLRLWVYGTGLAVGLLAFCWTVVTLTRRSG